MIDPKLKEYATEQQAIYIDAVNNQGSLSKAAEFLGKDKSTVGHAITAVKKKAAIAGHSPDHDMTRTVPDGFSVKGVSSYYNKDGELSGQWVKSCADQERREQMVREAIQAMCDDIPKAKPVKKLSPHHKGLASQYTITDYHIGMLAWAEETGADWDTGIAEDTLYRWFAKAVSIAPDSELGIFAQLGDFLHFDGLESVTPTNRHVLDADTRFDKLVRVAIRVTRRIINLLLEKHKKVHVILAEGNHDLASSAWLRTIFYEHYENEPRITIDRSPKPYYAIKWGETALFYHHGHKKKFEALPEVFASMFREIYGSTKYAYGHTGHLHHSKVLESGLMIMEQHRTLAAPDAHATRGGWLSGRSADVIVYSDECGQIGRHTIPYKMIQGE